MYQLYAKFFSLFVRFPSESNSWKGLMGVATRLLMPEVGGGGARWRVDANGAGRLRLSGRPVDADVGTSGAIRWTLRLPLQTVKVDVDPSVDSSQFHYSNLASTQQHRQEARTHSLERHWWRPPQKSAEQSLTRAQFFITLSFQIFVSTLP